MKKLYQYTKFKNILYSLLKNSKNNKKGVFVSCFYQRLNSNFNLLENKYKNIKTFQLTRRYFKELNSELFCGDIVCIYNIENLQELNFSKFFMVYDRDLILAFLYGTSQGGIILIKPSKLFSLLKIYSQNSYEYFFSLLSSSLKKNILNSLSSTVIVK